MLADLLDENSVDYGVQGVARLYAAYFLRNPDDGGFQFWLDSRRSGWSLWRMSEFFAESDEFVERYGELTDEEFVDLVYQNVMNRAPDAGGREFWVGQINGDMSRGDLMTYFSDSAEYRSKTGDATEMIAMQWLFAGRIPTDAELADWAADRETMSTAEVIQARYG